MRARAALALGAILLAGCAGVRREETPRKLPSSWFLRQRTGGTGVLPVGARTRAWGALQGELQRTAGAWEPAGPLNVGGRVSALAVDPNDPGHLWLGAADGGVFQSFDGGTSWTPSFDGQPVLAVGAMAAHPTDSGTLWVGTGEEGGGGYSYDGEGVFRTTDGGQTWTSLGLAETRRIGKLAVDPVNPQRIFVAAGGGVFHRDVHRGIYRTTDGGSTWQKVLYVADDSGGVDVAIDPANPNRVYAAIWQRNRADNANAFGGPNSAVWRSLDGGTTWTKLAGGLPTGSQGRIGLAIARSNPQVVYAAYNQSSGSFNGVWRSANGGDTWIKVSTSQLPFFFSTYGYYFGQIRVHPTNENTVFLLDLDIWRSTDGGRSYSSVSGGIHVDQHDLVVEASGRYLAGNDGGFYRSLNAGGTWTHATTLPISQFYDLCVSRQDPLRRFGGTQDNGTIRTITGGTSDWTNVLGGDGMQCEVDPLDQQKVYAESQWGGIARSTNGGASFVGATSGIDPADRTAWVTPITLDPTVPSTLYTGTYRIYRSIDAAVSWAPISPDLTDGPAVMDTSGDPDWRGQDHGDHPIIGTVTAIAVSPLDRDVIWAGTDDGNVWVTDDGGAAWTRVDPPGPTYWVTEIAPDPRDPHTAYLTVAGYRSNDRLPYVRKTTDLGATWADVTGAGLPQVPVTSIALDPDWRGRLYVADDLGVFTSDDDGATWSLLGTGMPSVVVQDLVLDEPSSALFAGTHGRSLYRFDLAQLPPADGDGDGADNNTDCALADADAFSVPGEVPSLSLAKSGTDAVLSWTSLASQAGPGTRYDLATDALSALALGGTSSSSSLACAVLTTTYTDASVPPADAGVYYLVRGRNACGRGSWGRGSDGVERNSGACP